MLRSAVILTILCSAFAGWAVWSDVRRQLEYQNVVAENQHLHQQVADFRHLLVQARRDLAACRDNVSTLLQERDVLDRALARLAHERHSGVIATVTSYAGTATSWASERASLAWDLVLAFVQAYWALAFGVTGMVAIGMVVLYLAFLAVCRLRIRFWNWRAPPVAQVLVDRVDLPVWGPEFVPERYQPGSDPHPVSVREIPAFQAAVYTKARGGSEMHFQGYALNLEGFLLMPLHVKEPEGVPHDQVVLQKLVGEETRQVTLGEDIHWMEVAQDAVAADMTTMKCDKGSLESYLGLARGKAADITEMTHCAIIGGMKPARTMGAVRHLADFFGQVQYTGTTFSGYSGAAYYANKTVYGMHTAAWLSMNIGYSAAYLAAILRKRRGKKESSEDYVLKRAGKQRQIVYRTSPGDPEEIIMKVDGRFYTFDASEIPDSLWERMRPAEDVRGSGESYNDEGNFLGKRPAVQMPGQMGQSKKKPENQFQNVSASQRGSVTGPNAVAGPSGLQQPATPASPFVANANSLQEVTARQELIAVPSPDHSSGMSSTTGVSGKGLKSQRRKK
uniref:Uncharacterized protein n=1 Tax=Amblyomma triste TaxID=251400 RepID=A0A023G640_AMBTT